MENQQIIQSRIDATLETLLSQIYSEMKITSGDITPEQSLLWDSLTEKLSKLFGDLIAQNTEANDLEG